jgi:uncharacterized protein (UPF0333 family)
MKRGLRGIKKGQAAMEFLMTYGWALLVVLVAIGALAFFGVLNPGQFLPDQCTLFAGLSCLSYFGDAQADMLNFQFQNGLGYSMDNVFVDILLTGATVGNELDCLSVACLALDDCTVDGANVLNVADGSTFDCDYDNVMTQGDRVKGKLTVRWDDDANNARVRDGQFSITAEGP